jgi:hypothetical protein
MFNIDRYINKSIVNQFPSFVKNLNEATSQKAFFDKIFSMADQLADVVNTERAAGERTERQAAAIRGYAERGRTTAARQTAVAVQARAAAADRMAAAREASSAANVAAAGAKAETARQSATVEAIAVREKNKRENKLAGAKGDALAAQANVNNARAAEIYSRVNSDENIAMNHAKDVASRSVPTTPAIPPEGSKRETEALNAAKTLEGVLSKKLPTPGEMKLQVQAIAGRGLVLPQPKKGTPSIELEPDPTPSTKADSTPKVTNKQEPTSRVKARRRAADTPGPTPASVNTETPNANTELVGSNKNRRSGGGSTTGTSTSGGGSNKNRRSGGGSNKNRRSVGEGLMPEHAMMAAQIRRENLMRKRNDNPPDERY